MGELWRELWAAVRSIFMWGTNVATCLSSGISRTDFLSQGGHPALLVALWGLLGLWSVNQHCNVFLTCAIPSQLSLPLSHTADNLT